MASFWDRLMSKLGLAARRARRLDEGQLLQRRVVRVGGSVTPELANEVIAHILYLLDGDPVTEIGLWIDTNGGVVVEALAIYEVLRSSSAPIATFGIKVGGVGALLLAAGTKGRRLIAPGASVFMAEMSQDRRVTAKSVARAELRQMRAHFARALAESSSRPLKSMLRLMRVGAVLSASGAVAEGFADACGEPKLFSQISG